MVPSGWLSAPPAYKQSRTLAWIATGGLALTPVTELLLLSTELLARSVSPHWNGDEDRIHAVVMMAATAWSVLLHLVALGVASVTFLAWLYRSTKNAGAIGYAPRTTPIMAVVWWFVPVAHLFRPYRVLKELYWATDPDATKDLSSDWIRRRPALLPVWWAAWVISLLLDQLSFKLSAQLGDEAGSQWLDLISLPVSAFAAGCAMAVLWSIQVRQEALAEARPGRS